MPGADLRVGDSLDCIVAGIDDQLNVALGKAIDTFKGGQRCRCTRSSTQAILIAGLILLVFGAHLAGDGRC